jgi:hypothetical protein
MVMMKIFCIILLPAIVMIRVWPLIGKLGVDVLIEILKLRNCTAYSPKKTKKTVCTKAKKKDAYPMSTAS